MNFLQRASLAWRLRKAHIFANAWAFCIGLLAIIGAINYFLEPEILLKSSAIGIQLKGWAYVWNAFYLLGGLGMVIGIVTFRSDIDVLGLCLFAAAVLIEAIAVISINPPNLVLTVVTFVALFLAALMRIFALAKRFK